MDISGDSTPTSEASYSLSGTPTTHGGGPGGGGPGGGGGSNSDQPMGNALPRLSSHPTANSSASVATGTGATGTALRQRNGRWPGDGRHNAAYYVGNAEQQQQQQCRRQQQQCQQQQPEELCCRSHWLHIWRKFGLFDSLKLWLYSYLYALCIADDCAHTGKSGSAPASSELECSTATGCQGQGSGAADAPEDAPGPGRPRCTITSRR